MNNNLFQVTRPNGNTIYVNPRHLMAVVPYGVGALLVMSSPYGDQDDADNPQDIEVAETAEYIVGLLHNDEAPLN